MSNTRTNHTALAKPDRSALRKMSMNTAITVQIQSTHTKNSSIVQNMFRSGYDERELASGIRSPSAVRFRKPGKQSAARTNLFFTGSCHVESPVTDESM